MGQAELIISPLLDVTCAIKKYIYTQITNLDELRDIIEQCQVDSIVVTDGPSVNAYIDFADVGLR